MRIAIHKLKCRLGLHAPVKKIVQANGGFISVKQCKHCSKIATPKQTVAVNGVSYMEGSKYNPYK